MKHDPFYDIDSIPAAFDLRFKNGSSCIYKKLVITNVIL